MSYTPALIEVPQIPEQDGFLLSLPEWLASALPEYLPTRRWFGDKAKTITSVEIVQLIPINGAGRTAALAIAVVHFPLRESTSYLLPVIVSDQLGAESEPLIEIRSVSQSTYVIDALTDQRFRVWFAGAIAGHETAPRLIADHLPAMRPDIDAAIALPNRLLGLEQSNTSIAFGSDMVVKVLRRLQPGTHPDVELTRFLTARTSFTNVPHYFGSLSVLQSDGDSAVIAVAQQFIESSGDGWGFLLNLLRDRIADGNSRQLATESETIARQLGQVTAEMHLALASDPWTTDVAPETIKRADADRWSAEYLALIDRITAELSDHLHRFDAETRDLVQTFVQLSPGLRKRHEGFYRLVGRSKTRVHGDYHLGQTLRTITGDFVVIDFEGEPLRTIDERRQKSSPLKDVAGMLRSFGYARGTATAWLSSESSLLASDLVNWERIVRREFLSAYVESASAGGATFLPLARGDLHAALASWELDKAAYEVIYELNNRPDWLWIPLSSMLKQSEPDNEVHT